MNYKTRLKKLEQMLEDAAGSPIKITVEIVDGVGADDIVVIKNGVIIQRVALEDQEEAEIEFKS